MGADFRHVEKLRRHYLNYLYRIRVRDQQAVEHTGWYRYGAVLIGASHETALFWTVRNPRRHDQEIAQKRTDIAAELYAEGYDYVLTVEHEDRAFEKTDVVLSDSRAPIFGRGCQYRYAFAGYPKPPRSQTIDASGATSITRWCPVSQINVLPEGSRIAAYWLLSSGAPSDQTV